MRHLLAIAALAAFVGPAAACINDAELPNYEREFRSQYRNGEQSKAPSSAPTHYLMYGGGAALLAGAAAVTFRRLRG